MLVISSREFCDNQKKYLDLADSNQQVIIQRGKGKAYALTQPEQLKHNLAGFWSRRISQEHRLVYAVDEKTVIVTVISAKGHYQ